MKEALLVPLVIGGSFSILVGMMVLLSKLITFSGIDRDAVVATRTIILIIGALLVIPAMCPIK